MKRTPILGLALLTACGAARDRSPQPASTRDAGAATTDAGPPGDAGVRDAGNAELPATIETRRYPNGIAADAAHVYVVIGEPHSNPNSVPIPAGRESLVQVFSTVDGSLVKEIVVPGGGHSLRLAPDGETIYVAHFSMDHLVTAISTSRLEVVASVGGLLSGISVPDALSIAPDGRWVYVGNNGVNEGWVSRIDTATHEVDPNWRVEVTGGYTCWVEVAPDGEVLYANSWTGGTVQRKEIATQSSTNLAAVGDFPHAVAIDPTGAFVYALVSGGNMVRKLDATTLDVVLDVDGPFAGFWGGPVSGTWSHSGRYLFVANHALGSVAVLDTRDDTVVATLDVGMDPIFTALSPDGARLYVANNESATITTVDVSAYR